MFRPNKLFRAAKFILFMSAVLSLPSRAKAKEITSGTCGNLEVADIPVGDFSAAAMPQSPLNINQKYNTAYDEGYWAEGVWMYGHDGLDTEGQSDTAGVNDVKSILDGKVILSKAASLTGGWGESVIIATRANQYSAGIITHHYHHMHAAGAGNAYATTRRFNACDGVYAGSLVGKEGNTGNSGGSHLHLSVRRWQNIDRLNAAITAGGYALFGYGYVYDDTGLMAQNLDPQGLLFGTYADYQWEQGNEPDYAWSLPYALLMRSEGIEFGLFDGSFGAGNPVAKRELARWLKTAAKLPDAVPQTASFDDMPLQDPDSVCVERLLRYPQEHPVFDPAHTCQSGTDSFCPDAQVNRAEALKAVILAFYGDEFISDYDNNIWSQSYYLAIQLLDIFTDVPAVAWYAPYVYFGVNHGLVSEQDFFMPQEPVRREQMAKWVVTGINHLNAIEETICHLTACPAGSYCNDGECVEIPACMPSETEQCQVGGGYDGGGEGQDPAPSCAAGYTACQGDCCDNLSESCFEGACWCAGSFVNCGDGVCRNYHTDNLNCGGCGNVCDSGETCTNGFCVPGQACECSGGACCDGCHIKPDSYLKSASQACYGNPQGAGTPTLCLEIQQVGGPNFRYRACKQGGAFLSGFTHQLKDNNNLVNFNKEDGAQGITCTGWKNFEVSYIGYGSSNAAGLQAEIISPAGCGQAACKYKTGTITITKTCD